MASTLPLTQLEQELRTKVATSCRIIGNRNVTRGALGHVSARVPGTDRILIKAKGPDEEALEYAVERDVIVINIRVGQRSPETEECLRRVERLLTRIRGVSGRHGELFMSDLCDQDGSIDRPLLKALKPMCTGGK